MTEATSTKDDMLMWKKGMKESLQVEDFDFEDGTQEEDEEEDPLGLATNKRTRKGQEEGKEEKKNKWEVESQATRWKLAASILITWIWLGKPCLN